MVAVSGDPLRTNAYSFAHNGILGLSDDEGDPSRPRSGRALLASQPLRGARS